MITESIQDCIKLIMLDLATWMRNLKKNRFFNKELTFFYYFLYNIIFFIILFYYFIIIFILTQLFIINLLIQ